MKASKDSATKEKKYTGKGDYKWRSVPGPPLAQKVQYPVVPPNNVNDLFTEPAGPSSTM